MLEVKTHGRSSKGSYALETAIEQKRVKMPEHTGRAATETGKVERILAPTDFSRLSEAGVRYAVNAARELGAEVIVYHVMTANSIAAFGRSRTERVLVDSHFYGLTEAHKLRLRRFLEKILDDAGEGVRIREKVDFGTPEKDIVKAATAEKADLIVMSMDKKGKLARIFSSGVTENVIRNAPCPVIVVPSEFAAVPHTRRYKKAA
jgi:nucleotide-binding universal stress UspA family protein